MVKYPIDAARLGVTGWSYGGFMTMWTVTKRTASTPPLRALALRIGKLLWPEPDRSVDDPILRRIGLRRSSRLRKEFANSLHQKREHPHS